VSPAEMVEAWEAFKRDNPNADPVMFEAWLDLRAAQAPIPVLTDDDVRALLGGAGS
jgi:hypothetical protein